MADSKEPCGCDESKSLHKEIERLIARLENIHRILADGCESIYMDTERLAAGVMELFKDYRRRVSCGTDVKRAGIIEGENEFARWLDRKSIPDGDDEKAVNALARYRMGRGW
jgi:hypothetical protein